MERMISLNAKYTPAAFGASAFNCPHCGVYANQTWLGCLETRVTICDPKPIAIPPGSRLTTANKSASTKTVNYLGSSGLHIPDLIISKCGHCAKPLIWYNQKILFPDSTQLPLANISTPVNIKTTYDEAASIFAKSPRAAIALLRLALQELLTHLGGKGDNINDDIAKLYKENVLNENVKDCCDIIRVSGNNAVHPGVIYLNEDLALAIGAFELFNIIVEECIAVPARRQELLGKFPQHTKDAIQKRDSK